MSSPDTADDARAVADQLRPEDVSAIFREFLGREASPGDVAMWMQIGSLRAFLDGVLTSAEYAQRLLERSASERAQARGHFLNCWIDGWRQFARPPGELSPDGVVIVGRSGQLFIHGGSNHNLAAQRGEVEMAAGWIEEWSSVVTARFDDAQQAAQGLACLVVPEKLAVYADQFPETLVPRRARPVLRLLEEARLPLLYPLALLSNAREGGETYLLTDSHLTTRGNLLLAQTVLSELGVDPGLLGAVSEAANTYLGSGDLGSHFDPPVLELMRPMAGSSRASVVSDNWAEVSAVGGHIGTLRVFRREDAPDERTLVVFGDSYSFGDDAYQGLSWFLAQVFREVHFVWAPFGWDPDYLNSVGAELVVCQTAERFVGRVPRPKVDVRSLIEETIDRRRALTDERLFEA